MAALSVQEGAEAAAKRRRSLGSSSPTQDIHTFQGDTNMVQEQSKSNMSSTATVFDLEAADAATYKRQRGETTGEYASSVRDAQQAMACVHASLSRHGDG